MKEIIENLFFIQRGYLNGNHFVYRSDKPVLIDTGYSSGFEETRRLLKTLGVDVSSVSRIVNTHCHCDHIGGNAIIQKMSGCEIFLHKIGAHFIDSKDDWSTWWRYYGQQAAFFDPGGRLEDGDIVNAGPHRFQVIHTPGHAADGIVLYNREKKTLLSSDTLWEKDVPVMTVRVEGSACLFHALKSLDRLASLDVDMVYPGHGAPFSDFKQAVGRARKKIVSYLKDRRKVGRDLLKKIIVYTILMKKRTPEETFFERLMTTPWFKENVDFYFDGEYRGVYDEIMKKFLDKGILHEKSGMLRTRVKP